MYYVTFLYLGILSYFSTVKKKDIDFKLVAIPFVLIAFLRFGMGIDYFSYNKIYDSFNPSLSVIQNLNRSTNIEFIFRLLNIVFVKLRVPYHIFSSLFTLLITYFVFKLVNEKSDNRIMSIFIFYGLLYFYWNLSALRQGLVLTVMIYVFMSDRYDNVEKFIITILMIFVHKSAIIVPFFYFLSQLFNWNKKYFLLLLLLAPLSRVGNLFDLEALMVNIPIINKATKYLEYNSISYFSLPALLRLFFIIILIFHYDRILFYRKDLKKILNFSLITLIFYFYLPTSMLIGTRTTIFGYYLLIILIPTIINLYDYQYITKLLSYLFFTIVITVLFINEFDKQARRSGYNESIHKLNMETIFSKNYNHFSNGYAFDYYVQIINDTLVNKELETKINSDSFDTISSITDSNDYFSVYFPSHELYGVINTDGKIVLEPQFEERVTIIGPYLELINDESFLSDYTYYHILNLNTPVPFGEVKKYFIPYNIDERKGKLISRYDAETKIKNMDFLEIYGELPVIEYEWFQYLDSNYSVIRLATTNTSYYILLKDDEVLVPKLYKNINLLNENNIIRAHYFGNTDFINEEGEIVWYEN